MQHKRDADELEYEQFPGQSDIRVSTMQTTPKGDRVRAIVTTGNSLVLAAVGEPNGDILVLTGDPNSDPNDLIVYKGFWDTVEEFVVGLIKDLIKDGGSGGGGGQKCTTTTQVNVGKDGKVTSITTTTTCSPA